MPACAADEQVHTLGRRVERQGTPYADNETSAGASNPYLSGNLGSQFSLGPLLHHRVGINITQQTQLGTNRRSYCCDINLKVLNVHSGAGTPDDLASSRTYCLIRLTAAGGIDNQRAFRASEEKGQWGHTPALTCTARGVAYDRVRTSPLEEKR